MKGMDRKVVVITGISRGLGRAMAEEFARRGHTVAGCSRSESARVEISKALPGAHLFSAVDVCDTLTVENWAKTVVDKVGAPDLLLNNAALVNQNAALWEIAPAEFSKVIDVNIKGVFHV